MRDELRLLRHKLGFDYSKFDFVIHQGKPVAARSHPTPRRPKSVRSMLEAAANLADGFEGMIEGRRAFSRPSEADMALDQSWPSQAAKDE
ncbi:hypothetical protein [Mesorhizobium sp. M1143]|uniref:hypothetical protein n=1 Tax=Mesorhizobium sp. M1143 TaxID=2957061 RepID=UPI003334B334